MYFLKCNNCGHLDEVKTEYQVFCTNCNNKIENNYADWHKRNPEKTIDEYKQLICISSDEINSNNTKPKSKSKSKSLKYWIGFTIAFIFFTVIGKIASESVGRFFKSEKTSEKVLEQEWIKETYGDYRLTVETPVKLTKGDLPVPDNIKQMIEKMDIYEYMSAKGFKLMINCVKYKPIVGAISLSGAANGSINEAKMQPGVTDFNYTAGSMNKGNIPGFIQKGTYKQSGIGVEFINTGFAEGLNLWQVMVIYQVDDLIGRKASDRVIQSIDIKTK